MNKLPLESASKSFRCSARARPCELDDLRQRLANRVQLTTEGHKAYLNSVDEAFGIDVDYAQLVKLYGEAPEAFKVRYSPAECIGTREEPVTGNPD